MMALMGDHVQRNRQQDIVQGGMTWRGMPSAYVNDTIYLPRYLGRL